MAKKKMRKPKEIYPKVYPPGLKLMEIEFDYKFDVGIPGKRPIAVRSKMNFTDMDLATVELERMQGSISIDTARRSATKNRRDQTESVKRLPRKTGNMRIGLTGTEPL